MMEYDNNYTPNSVGTFPVKNKVILAPYLTLLILAMSVIEKVDKIWLKHFLVVMMGNDKNCTRNNVGMF